MATSAAVLAGTAHAARVNAMRAIGTVVKLDASNFQKMLRRTKRPLVIHAEGGVFSTKYLYLTSYRGMTFFTKSNAPLALPPDAELIIAEEISVPE